VSLVLIADDDKATRAQLLEVLEKAGHKVIQAATASETLHQAQDNEPDLILLDIRLPDRDALELLEEIRSEQSLVRTPIMVMAEGADQELLTRTFLRMLDVDVTRAARSIGRRNGHRASRAR
jgi:CheY-like chemotaxis protein